MEATVAGGGTPVVSNRVLPQVLPQVLPPVLFPLALLPLALLLLVLLFPPVLPPLHLLVASQLPAPRLLPARNVSSRYPSCLLHLRSVY